MHIEQVTNQERISHLKQELVRQTELKQVILQLLVESVDMLPSRDREILARRFQISSTELDVVVNEAKTYLTSNPNPLNLTLLMGKDISLLPQAESNNAMEEIASLEWRLAEDKIAEEQKVSRKKELVKATKKPWFPLAPLLLLFA